MISANHLLSCCATLWDAHRDPIVGYVAAYAYHNGAELWSDRLGDYLQMLAATWPESAPLLRHLAGACRLSWPPVLAAVILTREQLNDQRRGAEHALTWTLPAGGLR